MTDEPSILDRDQIFMHMALGVAKEAYRAGEVPVGAVLVKEGEVIATGYNRREGLQDPTAHAELLAIRAAAEVMGSWRLTETTLYVTLEPCTMCVGAIIQSRIARLVFGAPAAVESICDFTAETLFNHHVIVQSGILAEDCRHLLQQFFQQLREAQPVPS
jgi:tRNA(adenine34) deaminase